ncbi:ABC transporter ATP-binding protein [Lederbergia wuyishanensis]|nr:ABC transporter ATP-binding protein [Lederbergia wuyishanensis]
MKNVCKRYGKYKELAVNNFNLDIDDQEFLVFLGPSGCGKSTTLRMVAGLEDISEGEIYIGDTLVNEHPPKDRDISMVFQNYALYPNLTVYENIAFGLRIRKLPKHEIESAVKRAARVLEIGNLLDRKPRELSGGQRQRVALGRAIVRSPQAFLMDEPLSNLDAKLRVQMRAEIIRLHRAMEVTTIYVTHDQIEAMTMGDRIVVMNRGVIQQVDTPEMIYNRPKNMFVAKFIGNHPMNFFEGTLREVDGKMRFFSDTFSLQLTDQQAHMMRNKRLTDYTVTMGIRPEHTGFEQEIFDAFPNAFIRAELNFNEFVGSDNYYHLTAHGKESFAVRAHPRYRYSEGEKVKVAIDMDKALFFDRNSEELLTD